MNEVETMLEDSRRPAALLFIAGLFIFVSLFDYRQLTSLPLLRTPSAAVGLMLALLFAINATWGYRLRKGTALWMYLFMGATAVTALIRWFAGGPSELRFYLQWFQVFILFLILLDLAQDPRALKILLGSVVAAALFLAVLGAVTGVEASNGRSGFEEVNLNRQAYLYNLALLTLVWLMIERLRSLPFWQFLVLLAGAGILLVALLKTGSRGGFLAMLMGASLLVLLSARQRNLSAYAYVLPPLLLAGIGLVASTDLVIERLMQTVKGNEDNSRVIIWGMAWQLVLERPWTGQGTGFMNVLGGRIGTGALNAHNSYLQVVLAHGIPAFLLWLGLVGSVIRSCWQMRRTPCGALLLSLMTVGLWSGLTGDMGFNRYFWVTLALAANVGVYQQYLDLREGVAVASPASRTS